MGYKLDDRVRITHKDFEGETGRIVLISSNPRFYRYRVLLDTETKYSNGFEEITTIVPVSPSKSLCVIFTLSSSLYPITYLLST